MHFEEDKPGVLSPVPSQFIHFTEQIIHVIKYNLIKSRCNPRRKDYKPDLALMSTLIPRLYAKDWHIQEYSEINNLFREAGLNTVHMG